MSYQFFNPRVSKLFTSKLVFIEIGNGDSDSGSFFIYGSQVSIDGNAAKFTCWKAELDGSLNKSFELEIKNIRDLSVINERTLLKGEISSILVTELPYKESHVWRQPNPHETVKVSIENPFSTSLTELGLKIGSGSKDELTKLRNLANPSL